MRVFPRPFALTLLAMGLLAAEPAQAQAQDRIVVANRAVGGNPGTISVIDVLTNSVNTINLPGPGIPDPMYFALEPTNYRLFVGDRANNRVIVFDALDFSVQGFIPAGNGVFHQFGNTLQNQLWVVNDIDRTATVIDMVSLQVLQTINVAPGLGGTLHDVILDPRLPQAYITVNGIAGELDAVVRFSTETFAQTGIIRPGDNLHVGVAGDNLYIPAQDSNLVAVFNSSTLNPVTSIGVNGAHGAETTNDENRFYTTNITAAVGQQALFVLDTQNNTVLGSTSVLFGTPHNIALTSDNTRLYLTHSGAASTQVTFYDVSGPNGVPVFLGTLNTGNNPFAIATLPPPVPEPATWALLLGALPGAGWLWKRTRRRTVG